MEIEEEIKHEERKKFVEFDDGETHRERLKMKHKKIDILRLKFTFYVCITEWDDDIV